jgi:hypothetical protein
MATVGNRDEAEDEDEDEGAVTLTVYPSRGPREGVVALNAPDGDAVRNVPLM